MLVTVLLPLLLAAPQGGIKQQVPADEARALGYPAEPDRARFAPFTDAQQQPERTASRTIGAGDFDGDGNAELFMLAADGSNAGRISVQMPETADLGRFRAGTVLPAGTWTAAATYHTTTTSADFALLLDPSSGALHSLFYLPPVFGGPRGGVFMTQPTTWIAGDRGYELCTADHDGDGHDDITVLREIRSGGTVTGTTVLKLCMGTSLGYLEHETSVALSLPFRLEKLRVLDLDGDGLSDFVVEAPGLGVAAFADDRYGSFRFVGGVPLPAGVLRDLCTGDADGDGRQDFGLVLDQGVVLYLSKPTGLVPIPLLNPPGTGSLATARILDARGEPAPDVVAFPRNGQSFVVHAFDAVMGAYLAPRVVVPPDAGLATYAGSGVLGESVLVADLDNDGDQDVALQLADGAHWLTLAAGTVDVTPFAVEVTSLGPVGLTGFVEEVFTVTVPADYVNAGIPQLEVAVFVEDPTTNEPVYWTRSFPAIDPSTRRAAFSVMVMTDAGNLPWMLQSGYTTHNGAMTAGGRTTVTIHGKDGTRRHRARLYGTDGQGGPNGSASGVKWKLVAAPPLPKDDQDLLPWN